MKLICGRCKHRCPGKCRRLREKVFRILDGRLTPATARAVERDMRAHPACFSRFEFTRIMRQVVRKRVLEERCPMALMSRVRTMISRDLRRPGGR